MNSTARRRALMTPRMKSPRVLIASPVAIPTTLSSGGSASAAVDEDAILALDLRPERLGHGGDIDLTEIQRGEHRTEAAGLHELGILLLVAGLLQQHTASAWLVERGFV